MNLSRLSILFSVAVFFTATGFTVFNVSQLATGKELYQHNCVPCHGDDGTRGRFGAKNLQKSVLPDTAITLQVQKGKGFMPSFRKRLRPEEIGQLALYVKSLRRTNH